MCPPIVTAVVALVDVAVPIVVMGVVVSMAPAIVGSWWRCRGDGFVSVVASSVGVFDCVVVVLPAVASPLGCPFTASLRLCISFVITRRRTQTPQHLPPCWLGMSPGELRQCSSATLLVGHQPRVLDGKTS